MNLPKNLPNAIFTSRVTEALASLAVHVNSARNIAASLKPIKTAELDLVEEEEARPIITSISPSRITDPGSKKKFTIKGKNLTTDSVKGFQLFLENDPNVSFPVPPAKSQFKGQQFTAHVDLSKAPPGFYEVRITDENKTPHLPGFTVEIERTERRAAGGRGNGASKDQGSTNKVPKR